MTDSREDRIQVILDRLWTQRTLSETELSNLRYVEAGTGREDLPPIERWLPATRGMRVQGADRHVWFCASFHTPTAEKGCAFVLCCETDRTGNDSVNPQGLLFLNGKAAQGFDVNHTEAFLEPDTDYEMLLCFYLGLIPNDVQINLCLRRIDVQTEQLWYDLQVPLESAKLQDRDAAAYRMSMSALTKAVNLLDLRIPHSEEYDRSVARARDCLRQEFYESVCGKEQAPIVTCIGHTHIDMEWKWDRRQTVEKIQRSFATAHSLMEHYPEFRFVMTQPELYLYLKRSAPEQYAQLKQLVRQGRWETEGAMYIEADCNLSGGESLIRQILFGKRFFREEFQKDSVILLLPDTFGFNASLPQILRKSGIRHFVTSKISWNETNTFPYDTFLWQGIDGSEVFTNLLTTQEYSAPPARRTTYSGHLTPSQVKGTWKRYSQKEYADRAAMLFGYGDGGGGPTKAMLERQRRLAFGIPGMPITRIGLLLEHLDAVRESFDAACKATKRTPKWVGELYLELHRGTYTSVAKNKRNNRRAEFLLQKAEAISAADLLLGGSYDAFGLQRIWEKVLHNQFHDILPGSSIASVYEGTDRDYAEIQKSGEELFEEKLSALKAKIATNGGILLYNPLGFRRKGTVRLHGKTVETPEVPAFGWTVVPENLPIDCKVTIAGLTAENERYRLRLDAAGRIVELTDKRENREVFAPGQTGNEFQVFEDLPRWYDNWEISDYYQQKQWTLDTPCEITPVYDGMRAGFFIRRSYLRSEIKQTIWLYSDSPRIDFETEANWHEHHQLLKVAFPFRIHASKAAFEIPFGHVVRPTHQNTDWDAARFEVYTHKWLDIGDYGYGIGILNDGKYGCSVEGSTVKLTLLKCGTFPNPEADQGEHRFCYSLVPHKGDFRTAGVIREAYGLNQPIAYRELPKQTGSLPETYGAVACTGENFLIETMKKAESSDDLILRGYEAFDESGAVELELPCAFREVYKCDLQERETERLPLSGKKVSFTVSNFEIVTLKCKR